MARACTCLLLPLLAALAGCGGGSGGVAYGGPVVGTKTDYATVDTDNSANTINWTLEDTVLTVAPDGGSTQSFVGSGGVVVNGTAYGNVNQVDTYDGSHALVSYTVNNGTPAVNCVYDTPEAPLPTGTAAGVAWPVVSHQVACSNGVTLSFNRSSGSVVGIETVTVPAGTFTATRAQYIRTSANSASNVVRTESANVWYDTASGRLVKSVSDFTYTNLNTPNGYLVHETRQLLTAP